MRKHGIFLPKTYNLDTEPTQVDIQSCVTLPVTRLKAMQEATTKFAPHSLLKRIRPTMIMHEVHAPRSRKKTLIQFAQLALLLATFSNFCVADVIFLQASLIGMVGTLLVILAAFSTLLGAWMRHYYAQQNNATDFPSQKKQQFTLLNIDTSTYLRALKRKETP
jgi:hypothetical protein